MKGKVILMGLALLTFLMMLSVPSVFALSYEFDFNGDGVFETSWQLPSVGNTVQVDIWLDGYACSPSDLLFSAQLYFNYNPSVLQVNGGYLNDWNNGGPFDPGFSGFVQQEAGVYLLAVANFGFVTVTNNKIKLGTIQLERIASGDTQILAANDLGFGGYNAGFVADCNLASKYPSDVSAPITQTFSVLSYKLDFNSDQSFDYTGELPSVGNTIQVDIWLDGYSCPPSNNLFGAQLYFRYDQAILQVNDAYPNDFTHGGPFDPGLSGLIQQEPGVYLLAVTNFGFVTVTNNKIKLGTIQLERIASGDTQILAANDLGFGGYDDGIVNDCNLASKDPSDVLAFIISGDICEGNFDNDKDVDGTDAAVFKEDFGRSPFSNPCP